jgi:hypothetical protein
MRSPFSASLAAHYHLFCGNRNRRPLRRRISSEQTAQDVSAAQIQALADARAGCSEALDIVPADEKYGNGRFLSCASGLRVGRGTRGRSDRVFDRPAMP